MFIDNLRKEFDSSWYLMYYGVDLPEDTVDTEDAAIQHYLSIGARFHFSPSRAFDEVAYRRSNPDVDQLVSAKGFVSGFDHYLLAGRKENREAVPVVEVSRWQTTHPMYSDTARLIRSHFDPRWYLKTYPDAAAAVVNGAQPTAFMHYLTDGIRLSYSPNAWFDETWYLTVNLDINEAKINGEVPCGFFHYLGSGRVEGRHAKPNTLREIEYKYPGLTRPVALDNLKNVEQKLAPLKASLTNKAGKRLNVLIPTLDKNIMFGGYIALLNFLVMMQDRGWPIRFLILEDIGLNPALARMQFSRDPLVSKLLKAAEIVNLTGPDGIVEIKPGDRFLAYSMWMAHQAHRLAEMVGRRYIFFAQEFEPIFHAHDTWHALGASAYLKPHFAIFNSQLLRNFFRDRKYGVYAKSDKVGDALSAVFEHALAVNVAPKLSELQRQGREKRLLFYARPEVHAARNLFEIGLIALRRAVAIGIFSPEWRFDGVGTLGAEGAIDLGNGRFMHLRPKLEFGDYCAALRRYDLGLSLMYAPHPSVVPFEMAASGMVVVTNTYENRDKQTLRKISRNIVPAELSIEHITDALKEARDKTDDLEARVAGAKRPWVTNWKASFTGEFIEAVEKELQR